MTMTRMFNMYTMSQASAGSTDASASHTRCACAHAAFTAIVNILDAIILASIFVIFSLVILGGLSISPVLLVLVNLVCLLVFRHFITPKR